MQYLQTGQPFKKFTWKEWQLEIDEITTFHKTSSVIDESYFENNENKRNDSENTDRHGHPNGNWIWVDETAKIFASERSNLDIAGTRKSGRKSNRNNEVPLEQTEGSIKAAAPSSSLSNESSNQKTSDSSSMDLHQLVAESLLSLSVSDQHIPQVPSTMNTSNPSTESNQGLEELISASSRALLNRTSSSQRKRRRRKRSKKSKTSINVLTVTPTTTFKSKFTTAESEFVDIMTGTVDTTTITIPESQMISPEIKTPKKRGRPRKTVRESQNNNIDNSNLSLQAIPKSEQNVNSNDSIPDNSIQIADITDIPTDTTTIQTPKLPLAQRTSRRGRSRHSKPIQVHDHDVNKISISNIPSIGHSVESSSVGINQSSSLSFHDHESTNLPSGDIALIPNKIPKRGRPSKAMKSMVNTTSSSALPDQNISNETLSRPMKNSDNASIDNLLSSESHLEDNINMALSFDTITEPASSSNDHPKDAQSIMESKSYRTSSLVRNRISNENVPQEKNSSSVKENGPDSSVVSSSVLYPSQHRNTNRRSKKRNHPFNDKTNNSVSLLKDTPILDEKRILAHKKRRFPAPFTIPNFSRMSTRSQSNQSESTIILNNSKVLSKDDPDQATKVNAFFKLFYQFIELYILMFFKPLN